MPFIVLPNGDRVVLIHVRRLWPRLINQRRQYLSSTGNLNPGISVVPLNLLIDFNFNCHLDAGATKDSESAASHSKTIAIPRPQRMGSIEIEVSNLGLHVAALRRQR